MNNETIRPLPTSPIVHPTKHHTPKTFGEYLADLVATVMGSWFFIMVQAMLLGLWIVLNIIAWMQAWDPYPFILLNLILSFQAAFTAPILMMSQNRQNAIDRRRAESDYFINIQAEHEIEQLHRKIDSLRGSDIDELTKAIRDLEALLKARV